MERYKAQRYYRMEFNKGRALRLFDPVDYLTSYSDPRPLDSFRYPLSLDSFDFEEQTFTLKMWGRGATNEDGAILLLLPPLESSLFKWKVADIEVAKKVEALRARNSAQLSGTIYFFVEEVPDIDQRGSIFSLIARIFIFLCPITQIKTATTTLYCLTLGAFQEVIKKWCLTPIYYNSARFECDGLRRKPGKPCCDSVCIYELAKFE